MTPSDAAEALLDSLKSNPRVAGLEVREVVMQPVAGNQGFKVVYDFKFAEPPSTRIPLQLPKTSYRTICHGFMVDEWFYSISYTAAQRYYFQKDAEAFESVLRSFRLVEK